MINVLFHTPIYVWFILAELIYIGMLATKTRVVYLPTLFIIPMLFIGLKYQIFFSGLSLFTIYALGIIIGLGIGFYVGFNTHIKVIKNLRSIEIPGNYQTLVLILSYFFIRYFFGFLHATNPMLAIEYLPYETIIIGAFSGFVLGKALAFTQKFLQHP